MKSVKRLMMITLLSAMAIVLNLAEYTYLPPLPFGIRFGLANIIALMTIQLFDVNDMIVVNLMRVMLGNLLRGTIFGSTFWIALSGIVFSCLALIITKKMNSSILFSSIISAVFHTVGQVVVVMFIYKQVAMISILPYLLVGSIVTGILIGIIAKEALKRIKVS